jgi:PPOX class probable F420-dependent enzyme
MPLLDAAMLDLLDASRTATLATTAPDGAPRLVPVCYAVLVGEDAGRPRLYLPLDEKPKSAEDPRALARVRDVLARPRVALLVDHWDEDWSRLAWLRLSGLASLLEPPGRARSRWGLSGEPAPTGTSDVTTAREHAAVVAALRGRYPQYLEQSLEERPAIRVRLDRARGWWASGG